MRRPLRALLDLATVDTRALALVRIALALLVLADLAVRFGQRHLLYTDDGILPAHTLLLAEPDTVHLSYLLTTSRPVEATVFFVLAGAAAVAFAVGLRTRIAHLLVLLASVSLHARNPLLVHAGDLLLDVALAWTLFLPLGGHLSLDAALAPGGPPPPATIRSLAVLGAWLELAAFFGLSAVNRIDPAWSDGTALDLLLRQGAVARAPAVLLADHAPAWLLSAGTFAMRGFDGLLAVALLVPGRVRRAAAVGAVAYLLLLSVVWNLGALPFVVLALSLLSLDTPLLDRAVAGLRARHALLARSFGLPRNTPMPAANPADRFEAGVREVLAASLLACFLGAVPWTNEGLAGTDGAEPPAWTNLWNAPLGTGHRWALFGGPLPRSDRRLVIAATGVSGRRYDLLRPGQPLALDLAHARGDGRGVHRIALEIHLLHGWIETVEHDVIRLAERAHTLPWTGIPEPLVDVEAIEIARRIDTEDAPVTRTVRFHRAVPAPPEPADVLLPALGVPARAAPPDDASPRAQVETPITFDLLTAPRLLLLDVDPADDGPRLQAALDGTCPVSWARDAALPRLAARAGRSIDVEGNLYAGLRFVPGVPGPDLPEDVSVVLCQDFLDLHDVELDAAARTLTLWPPGTAGTTAVPLDAMVLHDEVVTPAGVVGVPVNLGGVAGIGVFEFHAPYLRLSPWTLSALGMRLQDATLELRFTPEGARRFVRHLRLPRVTAGPIFARQRPAVVSDSLTFEAIGLGSAPAALLGLDTFPAARLVAPAGEPFVYLGASTTPMRRPPPTPPPPGLAAGDGPP